MLLIINPLFFREAKSHGRAKNIRELIDDFGEVISASANCNGTKVALTIALDNLVPDTKLYILDVENDQIQWIDFATGETHVREDNHFQQ